MTSSILLPIFNAHSFVLQYMMIREKGGLHIGCTKGVVKSSLKRRNIKQLARQMIREEEPNKYFAAWRSSKDLETDNGDSDKVVKEEHSAERRMVQTKLERGNLKNSSTLFSKVEKSTWQLETLMLLWLLTKNMEVLKRMLTQCKIFNPSLIEEDWRIWVSLEISSHGGIEAAKIDLSKKDWRGH
ncbi:hypothetical protein PIB30_084404 [Stylosanthes scabra]|uniref:Uncharacterized protein n=1 Tax=Stylosanthes scabra TaxID=79078 RepID=A0ABU6WSC9_9FABA|nr:hypothetical protein [Stylosanthes scabra]